MIERFTLLSVQKPISSIKKGLFILSFLFCATPALLFAQPANNDCASAATITNLTGGCTGYNFTNATADLANGNCTAQGPSTPNTWFQFNAAGSELTVTSDGQSGPMEITLVQFNPTVCDFASATQLGCSLSPLVLSGLTAGTTYYLVITSPSGSEGNYNVCVTSTPPNPPPPNDNPCSATVVSANGSCTAGTTVDATSDWTSGDPACAGLGGSTVWYTTTLGMDMDALEVEVTSYSGDVLVMVGTFVPDCNGALSLEDYYCGNTGGLPLDVGGLTAGTQYWVGIGTLSTDEGTFQVCLQETGLPPGCSDNDFCSQATPYPTPVTGVACTPIEGCNIGATPEPGLAGSCNFDTEEVVWFSFTSDATAGLLSVSVLAQNPTTMSQPSIQVFSGSCSGLIEITDCVTGNGGQVTLVNESILANTSYLIAVSNSFGDGGYFDLCVQTFGDISACVIESDLYVQPGSPSFGSPDNGPYQPGETVTMCFEITEYTTAGNQCQWLQGIVPVFGNCWDESQFDPTASMPPTLYNGTWDWWDNIDYNDNNPNITIGDFDGDGDIELCHITEPTCSNTGITAGTIVPPGWFASNGNGDPDFTWGDGAGCNGTNGPWSFCFDLTTKMYPECDADVSFTDCSVKIYTFADGETGSWNGGASVCAQDVPDISTASLNCCEGPTVDYQEFEVCSGGAAFITLTSNQDPNVNYSWTVDPPGAGGGPNAYGALDGSGPIINQTLTNTTGAPVIITYTVLGSNTTEGCIGQPEDIVVTLYGDLEVDIPPVLPVCAGECADLEVYVNGGSGNYVNYQWNQGVFGGANVNVCPNSSTVYSVTVTDNLGCTGVGSVTVNANSNLTVSITANPGIESCQNFNDPATITASVDAGGSGVYEYQWYSTLGGFGGDIETEIVFDTDEYCVDVTDLITNCTGTACIDMIINELPFVIIVDPPSDICVSDAQYCFVAFTDPANGSGVWGGVADAVGCVEPMTLGGGLHQVSYQYTDANGCTDIAYYDFVIGALPANPAAMNNVTLCTGVPPQTYSIPAVAGATSYSWTAPPGATFTTPTNGTSVTINWGTSSGGQVCVVAVNDCGNSAPSCFTATIGSGPAAPNPPADDSFCSNTPLQSFSITAVPGASSYIWTVPPGVSITSGQTTTSINVNWGTAGSGQVCVVANNACGSSTSVCADVTITTIPAVPTPPANATICAGLANDNYSIAAVPNATTYNWTIPAGATITAGQGTTAVTINWGTATSGQVCITAGNSCGNSAPACFNVTIGNIPAQPNPPANASVCAGETNDMYSIAPVPTATSYTWTVPAGATITAGQNTTAITIDWGTAVSGQVCVTANNNCGSSPQACFNVTVNTVPATPAAMNNVTVCANTQNGPYTVPAVAGATNYTWTLPAGSSIASGAGTNTIQINFGATGGQVCVTANNSCGSSAQSCFTATINTIPASPTPPADAIICAGLSGASYSVANVAGATGYTWTVPVGAIITNGQGTNTIVINWGAATSGQVCITANNSCGSSPQACFDVVIGTVPIAPNPPSNSSICAGTPNSNYAIAPVASATSYTWTVPAGATITNGQNTTSINVNWGTATTGQICVTANNNCGTSPQSCFTVTVNNTPASPTPPANAIICAGAQGQMYSVAAVASATSYTWTVPAGATIANGQGTNAISINWAANATSGQICVTADNTCGMSPQSCFNVTINTVPAAATPPADAVICEGLQNATYTVPAVNSATNYNWTIPAGASIANGQGSTSITVNWGTASSGQVCVTTSNSCGNGPVACFDVAINTAPQSPIAPADATVCQGTTNAAYSINAVPGATAYSWTIPAGATITGQGTNAISINWGTASSGQVCVTADNSCGSSPQACFDITIDAVPASPAPPANNMVCAGTSGEAYSIAAVAGATGYTWTASGSATIASGQNTTNVMVNYGAGTSATICVTANNNCGSSAPACFTTTINPIPNALFTVDSPICIDGTSTITYTGSASAAATYTWNFNGGTNTIGATGAGPYEIDWNVADVYTISLTVSENGCISAPQTVTVSVEAPLAVPVINCNTTTSSIEFTWNAVPGATGYLVNGTPNIGTTYTVNGLNSGDAVTITVTALGNGACGNSEATATCTAQDCPVVDITLDAVAPICLDNNTPTITLNANVVGGTGTGTGVWAGTGITNASTGTFDPSAANLGNNAITYTYTEGPCSYSESMDIIVNEVPTADFTVTSPVCADDMATITYTGTATASANYDWDFDNAIAVTGAGAGPYEVQWAAAGNQTVTLSVISANGCASGLGSQTIVVEAPLAVPDIICNSTTSEITFTWAAIPGATGYIVNGVPQATTSYTASGLNAGDMATITVVAVGSGACGDSQATQTCTADDCPPVNITIDVVAPICLDANAAPFNLNAVVIGGTGNGTGQWQGPGITNAATGLFNPNAATVNVGVNTVTFFYDEGTCSYSESIDIVINEQPTAAFTVNSPICAGDNTMIAILGAYNGAATYVWDFGNGTVINDFGQESYEVQMPAGGVETISLQVIANNCNSEVETQDIQVDEPLANPVITCNTTTTSITFSWNPVLGANGYTVNGVPQGGTSYTASGLNTGDNITITVVAIGSGSCGNSSATQTCTAEDCSPIPVSIDPTGPLCQDPAAGTVTLNAVVTGGSGGSGLWSGNGIIDATNGIFDPNAPGVVIGNNTITYTYSEPPCNYTTTTTIEVNAVPSSDFSTDANACEGDEVTVDYLGTYSGAATYNWNFGNAIVVADLGQETYTLQFPNSGTQNVTLSVTNNGCTSSLETQSIQIEEPLAAPVINCTPTLTSVTFNWAPIVGSTGYIVNGTPQAGTSFEFTGLMAGDIVNITVVAVGNGPCGNSMATEQCEASDCPPVVLTIDPVNDICKTGSNLPMIDLNVSITGGTGMGTGQWVGNGITNANTGMFNPNSATLNNGANIVTFDYQEDGCMFSESITINIFAQPTANIAGPEVLSCANNQMVALSGSGSGTPSWTGPGIQSGGNTFTPVVDASGPYVLTVTDPATGCTNTAQVTVMADNSLPVADAGNDEVLDCNNDATITLSAGGTLGADYEVTWSGPGINAANMNDASLTINQPGTYILYIENTVLNCTSAPDTVNVTMDTLPPNAVIQFTGSLDCFNTSVLLTAEVSPGSIFEWLDPEGNNSTEPTISATLGGTYVLFVLNPVNGCTNVDSAFIDNLEAYPVTVAGEDQVIDCQDPIVTLDGTGTQTGATIVYQWEGPAGGIVGPNTSLIIQAQIPGMYILTAIDQSNNCTNQDTVFVAEDLNTPIAEAGDAQEFGCSDESLNLSGSASVNGNVYAWTDASGNNISNSVNASVEEPGLYFLTVINSSNNCEDVDSVLVSPPTNIPYALDLALGNPSCHGENDGFVHVNEVLGGTAPYTYTVDGVFTQDFPQIGFLQGDIAYTLLITDAQGCTYEQEVTLSQPAPLSVTFPTLSFDLGDSTELNPVYTNFSGIDTVIWTPMEFLNCPEEGLCLYPTTNALLQYTTEFQVTAIDINGCSVEASVIVDVIKDRPVYIPNAFSPNNDNANDVFMIQAGENSGIRQINYLRIFNRWGEIVFEGEFFQPDDPNFAWDGTLKGQHMNNAVFVYVTEIEFIDGFKILYKGDITLLK
jgi:large repetitive protein